MQASCAEHDGVLQARVFQARLSQAGLSQTGVPTAGAGAEPDVIAIIELAGGMPVPTPKPAAFGPALRHLGAANIYTAYWR